ncbi:hypothetical protein FB45DRAFT_397732 [Roridomyces roridus]|uniref:Uncharacterized protein n=1 Tax=Roridomyces roridus TaxID=1738132 RepID=A0AAD7C3L2_9AGAR|nr:hypothetical protein FB45DRAFT_397732 [Roridomyces roridus]
MIPAEMDDASYALALSLWTAEVDDEERLARETERAVAASWEDIASREIASEGESSDEEESEEQKHRRTQLAADALQRYRAEIESRMRGLNTTVPPPLGSDIQDDPVDAPEPAASPSHPNSPPNPTPHSETVPAGPAPHSETEPSSPGPHADSDHRHCPDHHCHDHHHSSHQPSPEQVERDLRPASRPPGEPIFRAGYRDHERQHELEMRDKERQRKKKEREDEEAEAEKQSQMAMVQVQRTTIAESSRKGKGKAKAVEDEAEEEEEEDAEALPSDGDDDEDEDQPSAPKGKRIPPTKGKSRTVTTVASRLGRRKRTRLVIRSPRPRREQQGPDAGNSDAAGSSGVGVESDGSSGNAAETCGRPPGPSCSFHAGHDWDPETDDNESDADWDAQWKDDSDWGDDGAGDDDGLDMNGDADDDDDAGEGWETERDEEEEDRPFTIDVTRCAHCGKTKQQLTGGKLRGLYGRTGERRHICSACCRRKNRDWKTFLLEHRFLEKRSVVDRTAWEHTFADRWVEAANCRTTEIAVKIKGPFARHLHEQQRIEVNRQKRAEIQSTQSCEVDECKSTELVSRFGALGIFCMSHGNRALRLSKRNPLVEPTDLMASFKADAGSFLDRESTYKVMIDGRILQEAEEDKSRCHACPAEVHRWRFLACTNGFRGLCRKHLSRAVLPVYVEQSSYSYFRRRSKLSHSSFVEAPAQGAIASVIATSALSWHWIRCRGCGVRIKHNAAGRSSLGTALDHRHGDPDGINGWLCFPCNTGPLVEYQHCEDTVDWVPKMIADVLALDGGTLLHREKFASWEAPGWISDYQQRSALAAASVPVYWEHSVHMSYLADLKKTVNYGDHPREEACHHCRVTGRPGGGTTHRRNRCMGRTENQAKRLAAMEHDPTNAADAYLESYQRHVVELVTRIPDIAETQPALKRVFDACQEDSDVRAYLATIPAPEEVDAVWMQGLEERMDRSPAVQGAIADLVKDLGAQRMDARTIHRFTFTKNGIRHLPPSDGWHFGRYPAL